MCQGVKDTLFGRIIMILDIDKEPVTTNMTKLRHGITSFDVKTHTMIMINIHLFTENAS